MPTRSVPPTVSFRITRRFSRDVYPRPWRELGGIRMELTARYFIAGVCLVWMPGLSRSAFAQPNRPAGEAMIGLMRQGERDAAAGLWDSISSSPQRNRAAGQLAHAMAAGPDQGGGALTDFGTLINLITSTIEPESWDANGGVGSLQGFPAGVYVDAAGCLRRTEKAGTEPLKASLRNALQRDPPTTADTPDPPLRKISLPRLERCWLRKVLAGEPIPHEMCRLAGVQRIEYIYVDESTNDLILAGPADDDGPCLSLDAWLHVFHNAWRGAHRFGCSIEPRPERMAAAHAWIQQSAGIAIPPPRRRQWGQTLRDRLGRQQIRVHGVDPQSHAAKIMVAADYHMKLIGMGIVSAEPHVPSYLSMVELGPDGQPPAMDVLRWWFTLDYDRVECDRGQHVFRLVGRAARVQCENEFLSEQGRRIHTGSAEPQNREFAARFTRQIDALAARFPVYRQLQGLFDLSLAAALIREHGLAERVGWEPVVTRLPSAPVASQAPVARDVETIFKVRELSRQVFITGVSGGVDADPDAVVKKPVVTAYMLEDARDALAPAAPYDVDPRWWWD